MFVDEVVIEVESGRGGAGSVSFRREKYVPRGGPDGGDGGRGGNVFLVADSSLATLLDFRRLKRFRAGHGQPGQGKRSSGRGGEDAIIRVPAGTIVTDADTGEMLADLCREGDRLVIAHGGKGGWGNFHFRSPTNQTPRRAGPGLPGEARRLRLTLKLIADVGLVGLPNAGKSTLLSRISRARPKIADYPFTTLVPNLGIVSVRDFQSMVVADIPGIVEGAHAGRGLGHRFLRHIERTRILAFLIDVTSEDPAATYRTLRAELGQFSPSLLAKPKLVVYTKADLAPDLATREPPEPGVESMIVSALTGRGLPALIDRLYREVRAAVIAEEAEGRAMERSGPESSESPSVSVESGDAESGDRESCGAKNGKAESEQAESDKAESDKAENGEAERNHERA